MKNIYLLYIILFFTGCVEKKEGILIDLNKHNNIVTVSYTNLSDSIYVINGILPAIMHKNQKVFERGDSISTDIDGGEDAEFYFYDETPSITNFYYKKDNDILILQKKMDSLHNGRNAVYFESVLVLYPKTTINVYLEIDHSSNEHYLQILDYYSVEPRSMYTRILPFLKDVNPNYYLYKYRFNSHSKIKINLK